MANLLLLLTVFAVGFVLIGLSFLVGMVFGWFANEYFNPISNQLTSTHPEMYDENGNYITEELIAVRFEEPDEDCTDDNED
jgi:hypothetical protein